MRHIRKIIITQQQVMELHNLRKKCMTNDSVQCYDALFSLS